MHACHPRHALYVALTQAIWHNFISASSGAPCYMWPLHNLSVQPLVPRTTEELIWICYYVTLQGGSATGSSFEYICCCEAWHCV